MSAPGTCRIIIYSKERNTTADVIKCCDEEVRQKFLSVPLTKATTWTAEDCDKSQRTRHCIRNRSNNCAVGSGLTTNRKA
jgi:hypothetical protein